MIAAASAIAAAAAAKTAGDQKNIELGGRWNVAFHMPQGSYETPIEFVVGERGAVKATVLGPLGTFKIEDTVGSLSGEKLMLKANTSYGRLKVLESTNS